MQSVIVSVLIDRPVTEVWNFFSDLRNSPRWTRSGSELRQTSNGTMGVGATVESRGQFGPFAITSQRLRLLGSRFVRAVGSSLQIELNTLKRLIEERASSR
jgi:hypothetical protein